MDSQPVFCGSSGILDIFNKRTITNRLMLNYVEETYIERTGDFI